jgi:hypothetical protein
VNSTQRLPKVQVTRPRTICCSQREFAVRKCTTTFVFCPKNGPFAAERMQRFTLLFRHDGIDDSYR